MKKKNVLITGGSGLVGGAVRQLFESKDYQTAILTRNPSRHASKSYFWDPKNGQIDPEAIEFADLIIHLAGENVASKAWSPRQKKKILESRTQSSALLYEKIASAKNPPLQLISASATGYYGNGISDKIFVEKDPPGQDFLAEVCRQWEESVAPIQELGIPVNRVRISMVISKSGGALTKILRPLKMGLGSALGSGKQWIPWISLEDLSRLFLFLSENNMQNEVFNAVAPQHLRQAEFMDILARHYKKPLFMPHVPGAMMKLIFGEMSSILLEGSRVSSEKIVKAGFKFKHPDLLSAIT